MSLRLPWGLKDLFEDWLARHFPGRKEKILNRIRSMRGGKLYEGGFHDPLNDTIRDTVAGDITAWLQARL